MHRSLLYLLLFITTCFSYKLSVPGYQQQCVLLTFSDDQIQHSEIVGQIEILGDNNQRNVNSRRNVDVKVYEPDGGVVWIRKSVWSAAYIQTPTTRQGAYQLCFNNKYGREVKVELAYFTLSHLVSQQEEITQPTGTKENRETSVAQHQDVDEVRIGTKKIMEQLYILRSEQQYLKHRLRRNTKTMRSTYERALWYTILEIFVLIILSTGQVLLVRYIFNHERFLRSI